MLEEIELCTDEMDFDPDKKNSQSKQKVIGELQLN